MIRFKVIRARAEKRKGGAKALDALLPPRTDAESLRRLTDDRILAEMAQRVFSAGFVWRVIEAKWPGFEAAFHGFEPAMLTLQPPEFWDALTSDPRIVRNGAKIMSGTAQRLLCAGGREGPWQFRRVPRRLALVGPSRIASHARGARQPPRRQHRPDASALPRLGWFRYVKRCGGLPARRGPRCCPGGQIEGGPREGAGDIQCVGQGNRTAIHPSFAHLRNVGRRKPRRGACLPVLAATRIDPNSPKTTFRRTGPG